MTEVRNWNQRSGKLGPRKWGRFEKVQDEFMLALTLIDYRRYEWSRKRPVLFQCRLCCRRHNPLLTLSSSCPSPASMQHAPRDRSRRRRKWNTADLNSHKIFGIFHTGRRHSTLGRKYPRARPRGKSYAVNPLKAALGRIA